MDFADILIARRKFLMMSQRNQRQWILDYLCDHSKQERILSKVSYFVRGYKTCRAAWQAAYGINSKRLEDVVKSFLNGLVVYENENQYNSVGQRHKTSVAKAWMQMLFSRIGDKMPDTLVINLPSYLDNQILYGYLKDDLTQLGEQVISYSQFCRILNLDFPDVLIPKVNRLTKCDICTFLKEEKQKTMDKTKREYFDNLYMHHNDLQREEREKYYYHRGKAKDGVTSKKCMCIIIDGMDQNKLLIPALLNQAKSYASAWRLKTHLTGVINHGREVLAFIDVHQWGHDSNFTINVLLRTLSRMEYIPDVLYVQMDNCWRENKNQFVIIFLAVLIKYKVFKKVKINFLMTGHTHEDIDQLFSRIAGNIAKNNIRILTELMTAVSQGYTPSPYVEFVDVIYDVRSWLRAAETELHNISNPHCFVLKENSDGDVVLKYKNWSRDKMWKPSNLTDEGLVILKANKVPRGVPNCVPPSDEKIDVKRLKDDIPKFFLSRSFEEHHRKWWMDFLGDKEAIFKAPDPPTTWPLEDIIRIKERQLSSANEPNDSRHPPDIQRPANVQPEVERLVAQQLDEIPEVYTGRYQNPQALATRVNRVSNPLEALRPGVLVAVNIHGYKKVPVLGKVIAVDESSFVIEYWKGSWKTEWKPWKVAGGNVWTDTLPKECILLVNFQLNENNKLANETYKYLKDTYEKLKES